MDTEAMWQLFVNRLDTYAVQDSEGRYLRIEKEMTPEVLESHLRGIKTVGVYQICEDMVKWVCFDFDDAASPETAMRSAAAFQLSLKIPSCVLESSGSKGAHVWVFCEPVAADQARRWAKSVAPYGVEVFPKQDSAKDGFGNLVKLPLGVHQRSGKWSFVFDEYQQELEQQGGLKLFARIISAPLFKVPDIKETKEKAAPKERVKKPIPDFIKELIRCGVSQGTRDKNRFIIMKEMWNLGYSEDTIQDAVGDFNANCKPPEDERTVVYHVKRLMANAEKYLNKDSVYEQVREELQTRPFLDAADAIASPLEFQQYWLWPLVPKNSIILFGGRPASWKSMFLLTMGMAASDHSNNSFLGFDIVSRPKVLLYDLENGDPQVRKRMKSISSGMGYSPGQKSLTVVMDFDKRNLRSEVDYAKGFDIIILDSYRRFLAGEENSSEITDAFYRLFLKPLREAGKTVIIVHHFRKKNPVDLQEADLMEMFRGSSDIAAQVDLIYGVEKADEKTQDHTIAFDLGVNIGKNRLGVPYRPVTLSVEYCEDPSSQRMFTKVCRLDAHRLRSSREALIDEIVTMVKTGTVTTSGMVKELLNKASVATVKRAIKDAVEIGYIIREKHGTYAMPPQEQEVLGHY